MTHFLKIFTLLAAGLISLSTLTQAADGKIPATVALSEHKVIGVGLNYHYLKDIKGNFKPRDFTGQNKQVLWHIAQKETLYLGINNNFVWVKIPIQNISARQDQWVLNVDWPFFDFIRLYVHDPERDTWTTIRHSGDNPSEKKMKTNFELPYLFGFSCPPGERRVLYIKARSNSKFLLPITIKDIYTHHQTTLYRNILLGIFFGIMIAMCGYNISLFLFTKDDSYAYYVVYVLSILFYCLAMTGVGSTYLWPHLSWLNKQAYGLFSSFSFMMAAMFIRRFLMLKTVGGWMLHLSNITIFFWIIIIFLYITTDFNFLIILEDICAVASCFIGLGISVILWFRGNVSAKYLTIAWAFPIVATFFLMMGLTGIIRYSTTIQHIQNFSFALEVLLLSIALAERINRTQAEKEAARKMTLQLHKEASDAKEREMKAQAQTLAVERAAKEELEHKVLQRTRELQTTMDELEKANQTLNMLSRTDGLTRLFNRRHFDEIYEMEFKRARRLKTPMSIIMGDIDHFKSINDTYGHQAGDQALQKVAEIWQKQVSRAGDMVARYGGEEFVALLPATDTEGAVVLAEKIRSSIESCHFIYEGQRINMTISLGVSCMNNHEEDIPDLLLQRADEAMYEAKTKGRNQVNAVS